MTKDEKFSIAKDQIATFFKILSDYSLYAPVKTVDGIYFERITNIEKHSLNTEFGNSNKPPKELLFPQTEIMFRYKVGNDTNVKLNKDDDGKKIIFGIRPCDAKGFMIYDQIFERDVPDPYYTKKRKEAILIGIACKNPASNCFCTSVEGGPAFKEGLDILLTDLKSTYVIEIVTKKGKDLIERIRRANPALITASSPADIEKALQLQKTAEEKVLRRIDLAGLPEKLNRLFDNPIWNKISLKCIRCGICTYLCPTCYCFDIQDEAAPTNTTAYELSGKRVRIWDSCMFPEYTLQASGYNPRPTRINRIRNRVYHKYKWHRENFKSFACTGCGRCINSCPGNVDIIDILSKIKEIRE